MTEENNFIEFRLKNRPCLVGVGEAKQHRGLFYGFAASGDALIEMHGGRLRHWRCEKVMLLDSDKEFSQHDWEKLGQPGLQN